MKINSKNIAIGALLLAINAMSGCKKDSTTTPTNTNTQSNTDTYTSVKDFFTKNAVIMQTYTVTGSAGGSFTTPQGTQVTIPANCFVNNLSQTITGPITIQFKDLYKKGDMLLSNMSTELQNGQLLKSGGEFYIKALSGNTAVNISGGTSITVNQPLNNQPYDPMMMSYQLNTGNTNGWMPNPSDSIAGHGNMYGYTCYSFPAPLDSGAWFNTDENSYFGSYGTTTLTLQTSSQTSSGLQAFLVFKTINTVAVYHTYPVYANAPIGLQCTLVVIDIQNNIPYSAFVPFTISANQTLSYTLSQTTTAAFKAQLNTL